MNKHTAGPWEVAETRHGYDVIIRGADRGPVATALLSGYSKSCGKANAALIAASPDLLAALEACLDRYATGYNKDDNEAVAARAAIKKARGEA